MIRLPWVARGPDSASSPGRDTYDVPSYPAPITLVISQRSPDRSRSSTTTCP